MNIAVILYWYNYNIPVVSVEMKKDQVMLVYMTTVKQSAQIVSTYIVNSLKLKPN
jgi:hypothetical protein